MECRKGPSSWGFPLGNDTFIVILEVIWALFVDLLITGEVQMELLIDTGKFFNRYEGMLSDDNVSEAKFWTFEETQKPNSMLMILNSTESLNPPPIADETVKSFPWKVLIFL